MTRISIFLFACTIFCFTKFIQAIDSLLSSIQSGFFDWNTKKFTGTLSTGIDDRTRQIDSYEYLNGKLTVVKRRVCKQVFAQSERSDCEIYELKMAN